MSKRLFAALPVPDEIADILQNSIEFFLKQGAFGRFVPKENFHITVCFLGNISIERMEQAKRVFRTIRMPDLQLEIEGAGFFKQLLYARVKESGDLARLSEEMNRAMASIGIPMEERPFRAHITLARKFHAPEGIELKIPRAAFESRNCILYQSLPSKNAPIYEPIAQITAQ